MLLASCILSCYGSISNRWTLTIELLLVASLVTIAVRRLRIPYTVALVLVGLLITFQQPIELDLTPELILALFVPPLVFEAAFHVEFRRLREALLPILVLAIPGVLLTTAIVGYIVSYGVGLSLTSGLVFGADRGDGSGRGRRTVPAAGRSQAANRHGRRREPVQ